MLASTEGVSMNTPCVVRERFHALKNVDSMNIRSASKVEVKCEESYQRCSGVSDPVLQMRHVFF